MSARRRPGAGRPDAPPSPVPSAARPASGGAFRRLPDGRLVAEAPPGRDAALEGAAENEERAR
jgi:hypothetical protein